MFDEEHITVVVGDNQMAAAGRYGVAVSGDNGVSIVGTGGIASTGENGTIVFVDDSSGEVVVHVGRTADGQLEPNQAYMYDGDFVLADNIEMD